MKHVSFKNDLGYNVAIEATLKKNISFNRMRISCSSYYTVFLNGKVVCFGPTRTAKGYTRIKDLKIKKHTADNFSISILYYGFPSFDIEFQQFFFGIDFYENDKIVGTCDDLCFKFDEHYLSKSCKYSFQRGLVERYEFSYKNNVSNEIRMKEINSPIELDNINISCDYKEEYPCLIKTISFNGFNKIKDTPYLDYESLKYLNSFNVRNELLSLQKNEYTSSIFSLKEEKTGLLHIKVSSRIKTKFYVVFDEVMPNDEWIYARSNCNDVIEINIDGTNCDFYSKVPYSLKYIMIIKDNEDIDISVSLICIENDSLVDTFSCDDKRVQSVYDASENTFKQNSFDIFTDCPGRERAGWLCDSYFMGFACKHLMGNRNLEKEFLENYIYSSCFDIPKNMLPMCYPSNHKDKTYIPNWAMWFVIELFEYYQDSHDENLLISAKKRVFNLVSFFLNYENEYGLLEDLPGWVFIEWSKANDYIEGISFPTNMLYAQMLYCVGQLYNNSCFIDKSNKIKDAIYSYSFFNGYYHDHAKRDNDNKIKAIESDISETAQYYALFFNLLCTKEFKQKMINSFGMNVTNNLDNVSKSNVFIGYFLRMFFLLREKEYEKLLNEAIPFFYKMSKETGTLWEKDDESASCNHGFTSCLSYIIFECYKNIKNI